MKKRAKIKLTIIILSIFFSVSLVVILTVFAVHCGSVKQYNSKARTTRGSETTAGVVDVIKQRGQKTDSWVKNDPSLSAPLNGIIYELTVTNGSKSSVSDWRLRIDITQDCYINNAWCGSVEIHQLRNGSESSQRLDLRNCKPNDITVEYTVSEGDILIPLQSGDYIIYYPSASDKETPIAAGGSSPSSVTAGLIFYSYSTSVNLTERALEYYLHKEYLSGQLAQICHLCMVLWVLLLVAFVILALVIVSYERQLARQDKKVRESLDVFSRFVDAKDPYTYGHSARVAYYSRKIAEELGFSNEECKRIFYIAMMHDIGKCYVPDEILKKPAKLTAEEYGIIKEHTVKGAKMVKGLSSIPGIYEGVLYHHERFDGKGYPEGKSGEDIPVFARIISVADAYDSMSSNRIYRSRLSDEALMSELETNRGTQFDPKVVDAFLKVLEKLKKNGEQPPVEQKNPDTAEKAAISDSSE